MILEINDLNLRAIADHRIAYQSPGIAIVDQREIVFGQQALARCRLAPLNTHTRFWSELSQQSLDTPHAQVRHNADLVYFHLREMVQRVPELAQQPINLVLNGPHLIDQLPLLLGIANRCDLNILRVIDRCAALSARSLGSEKTYSIEIDLHHTLVRELNKQGDWVDSEPFSTLPQSGWFDLLSRLMKTVTQLWINQQRFNPRHSAQAEQQLFDQLVSALHTERLPSSVALVLPESTLTIADTLIREAIDEWAAPIKATLPAHAPILIGDHAVSLLRHLPAPLSSNAVHLSSAQVIDCLQHSIQRIESDTNLTGLRYIKRLQQTESSGSAHTAQPEPTATHLLYRHTACPINELRYLTPDHQNPLQKIAPAEPLATFKKGRVTSLKPVVQINAQPLKVDTETLLHPGDRIDVAGLTEPLLAIEVET